MDAAFEERTFIPAIGRVVVLYARVPRPAIVAGEDNQRIVVEPCILQFLQDIANPPVKLAHHRAIDALGMIFDLRQSVIIRFQRL